MCSLEELGAIARQPGDNQHGSADEPLASLVKRPALGISNSLRAKVNTVSLEEPVTEPRTDTARRVFEYWKECTKHPRSKLDDKRMKLICTRLKDGYSEMDLKMAIFGCSVSKWNQGQNKAMQVYDSVELIFRNGDKVDWFMRIGEAERDKRAALAILEKQQVQSRIEASTCGDTYKAVRGRLLSLVKKENGNG